MVGWGCTNVHVEEEVNGEMIVEVVEVGLVEVAQEKFNIGLSHISGWAGPGSWLGTGALLVTRSWPGLMSSTLESLSAP